MKTSHDYADSLIRLAEFLRTKPAFNIEESDAVASLYLFWPHKEVFLGLVRAVHGGEKEYIGHDEDAEVAYTVTLPTGEWVKGKIRRSNVCKLIRAAEYDCEPLLSQAEEAEIGQVSA